MAEKRKVTMQSHAITYDENGRPVIDTLHEAIDYVPTDILDAYVADARSRWGTVTVGDSHDPGPAGDDGDTFYHEHLTGE